VTRYNETIQTTLYFFILKYEKKEKIIIIKYKIHSTNLMLKSFVNYYI